VATDWEDHYQRGETPWDKGAASPGLVGFLETNTFGGRVLVPGCGVGHDVRALAPGAEEVVGIDIAPSGITAARAFPSRGRERYEVADLFDLPAEFHGSFNGVWEHTCFCAINPSQRAAYVDAVAGALKPGGHLLAIFYLDPGNDSAEEGPPFEVSLQELDRLFGARFGLLREWLPDDSYPGREGREWIRLLRLRS
jgi:SAM-dependent methyltransferase